MRTQADAIADTRADTRAGADARYCAEVKSDALADALVRAWLHAPHHARCAAHGHACTGMHDDAHTPRHMRHMRTRTHRHPIMGPHA